MLDFLKRKFCELLLTTFGANAFVRAIIEKVGPAGLVGKVASEFGVTDIVGHLTNILIFVYEQGGREVVQRMVTIRADVLTDWSRSIHGASSEKAARVHGAMEKLSAAFADFVESLIPDYK